MYFKGVSPSVRQSVHTNCPFQTCYGLYLFTLVQPIFQLFLAPLNALGPSLAFLALFYILSGLLSFCVSLGTYDLDLQSQPILGEIRSAGQILVIG